MSVCTYDFVMSDQNFILTFLVLALRVIVRFSYDVVSRWNERWLGNITSATDHELWRCKGKKNVSFPIAFPSGSGRRALILHFPFIFDDWFRIPNFCHLYPKYRFVCQYRIPSQNFGESLFPASCQFPYPWILFVSEFCAVFWSNPVSRKYSSRPCPFRKNGSLSHKTMQPGIKNSLL